MADWDKWFNFEMKGKGIEDAKKMLIDLGRQSDETAKAVINNCQRIQAEMQKGIHGDTGLIKNIENENDRLVKQLEVRKQIVESGEKWLSNQGVQVQIQNKIDIDTSLAEAKLAILKTTAQDTQTSISATFNSAEVTAWAQNLISSGASIIEVYNAIEAKMAEISEEMGSIDHNFGTVEAYGGDGASAVQQDAEAFYALSAILDEVRIKVEEYQNQLTSGETSTHVIEQSIGDSSKAEAEVENITQRLENVGTTARNVGEDMKNSIVERLKESRANAEQERKEANEDVPFQNIQELEDCIEQTKGEIASLRESLQNSLDIDVESSVQEVKELEAELKRLEKMRETAVGNRESGGKSRSSGSRAPSQRSANKPIIQLDTQMSSFEKLKSGIASVSSAINVLENAFKRIGTVIGNAVSKFVTFTRDGIVAMGNSIKSVGSTAFHGLLNGFNALNNGARTAMSTLSSLASKGFGAIKNGIHSAVNGIHSLIAKMKNLSGKTSKNLLKSFSSIKSMLKRRIKRTFISAIFNQAREGLQQLAKYSSAFNEAMSSIKSASKQASGNLAVAFGNIVTMLAPAIQWLLNALSALFEKLNAIFALLTGKSTVTTAKKQTENYAQSLNDAGGAAKDLNKQLYGFDELTRQDDNSGGGGGSKIQYEESDVGGILGNLKEAFEEIKQAFENGEYEKVGELIAQQLNNIVYKINDFIVKLRPEAVKWSKNIARILNGLVEGWDAEATGKLLANGLNLVFDVISTFLETFKFDVLGRKIAEKINSLFEHLDWELVGRTWANWFNVLWKILAGFVSNAKWSLYGEKLSIAVNTFFGKIDFESIETAITKGLNGLIETLQTFIDKVEWEDIAEKISKSIEKIVTNIEWAKIGTLIGTFFNKAFIVARKFLERGVISKTFTGIGKTIGTALREIDWKELGQIVAKGIAEIAKSFTGFVAELDLPSLGTKVADGIQSMFDNIDWDARTEAITTGFNSVVGGLKNLVEGVNWAEFAKDFANGANSIIDGINWDNLANLVSIGINNIIGAFNALITSNMLVNLATNLGKTVGNILSEINWTELVATIDSGIAQLVEAFGKLLEGLNFENVATKIAEGVNSLFTDGENGTWSKAIKSVTEGVNSVIAGFKKLTSPTNGGINFQQIRQTLRSRISKLVQETDWAGLITSIGRMVTEVATSFWSMVGAIFEPDNEGKTLGDRIAEGINGIFKTDDGEINIGMFSELGKNFGEAIKGLFKSIGDFISKTDWEAIGESIGTALANIDWLGIAESLLNLLFNALLAVGSLLGGVVGRLVSSLLGIDVDEAREEYEEDYTTVARDAAQTFTDKYVEAVEATKSNQEASNAIASALAEWMEVDPAEVEEYMSNNSYADIIADILFMDSDEVVEALKSQEGTAQIAQAIADTLGVTQEEALTMLGDSGIASRMAEQLGITWEEAFGLAEMDKDYAVEKLVSQYKLTFEEAYKLLGETDTARILANTLGITYEQAVALFGDGMNSEALTALFAEGGESARNALMEGLYLNSESTESVIEYFRSFGIELTEDLASTFVDAQPKILSSSRSLLYGLADDATFQDVKATFYEHGKSITDEFAKAITGQGMENIDTALALLGMGVDEATISAMDISHLSENLNQYMSESGATLEDVANELGANVGDKIGFTIPDAIKKALKIGEKEVKDTAEEVASSADTSAQQVDAGKNATETGETVVSNIATAEKDNVSDVEEATGTVTSTIDDKIKELPESEQENAKKMMEMMVEGILQGDPLVQTAIEESANAVVDKVSTILAGSEGSRIVNTFLLGMKQSIDSNFESMVENNLASFSGQTITDIAVRLSYDNGNTIVYNLMQGMEDAILGGKGQTVVNVFGQFCSAILETIYNFFGIHSPSRVFNEIGQYMMEGMSIGIEDSSADAIGAISDVSKAIVEEGKGLSLETSIGNTTDGLDNVADKLTRVAQIFSGIASTISEMGGLQIPTIASGRSIPYRTQLGATSGASIGTGDNGSIEDAIYSAFTRALSSGDNNQSINITLMVDGRKMADIVSKYQRQQQRAWG